MDIGELPRMHSRKGQEARGSLEVIVPLGGLGWGGVLRENMRCGHNAGSPAEQASGG